MSKSALFLDRDGVINVDYGHVSTVDRFQFVEGIFDIVRKAQNSGYLVFVVTNQAGIGRGLYSVKDFHKLNEYMLEQFSIRHLQIVKTYYCPHHPTEAVGNYLRECECRKPKPGMLLQAAREFDLNLTESVIIGDSESDVIAGMSAGLRGLIFIGDGFPKNATHAFKSIQKMAENGFSFP